MCWSDIDWDKGVVRIERQLVQVSNEFIPSSAKELRRTGFIEGPPKTRSGVRSVALPDFGKASLRRQKAQLAQHRLKRGSKWPETEYVFLTENGTTPSRSNLAKYFHTLCRKLGVPIIRLHDLRHLHLSLLAMNGVPLKVAQQRAGHSSPIITMQVYSHVLGDADKQAAMALERAVTK